MKFITTQKTLNDRLSVVSKAIPSRASHPILVNVLVEVDKEEQSVALTGFDLSLGIQTSFNATVEEEGKLTLPAKLLGDIVSKLPDGEVTIEQDEELVKITSASGRYEMRSMSADEYPELTIPEGDCSEFPVEVLVNALKQVYFTASDDETKQILTGAHLKFENDSMEAAGCDGHRLAVTQESIDTIGLPSPEVTIPGKAIRELERITEGQSIVTVTGDDSLLMFKAGNNVLTTRLLEGQYPNYRQLIPKDFVRKATIDRRAFIAALERIAVLADQKNSVVKLSFSDGALVVSVDAQDVGSGREELSIVYDGDSIDIAFNVKYLIEGLKAIGSSEVMMKMNGPTNPAIVQPFGNQAMTYLLMPVSIRGV